MNDNKVIQGKVEGILFAMGESVAIKDIAAALEIEENELLDIIEDMKEDYAEIGRAHV